MKKIFCLSFIISVTLLSNAWAATYSGGDGSEANPFQIANAGDMNRIGTDANDWDNHFILTNNIDLAQFTGTQFNLIGKDYDTYDPFTGVFDGNGHSISNFTYTTTDMNGIGLFRSVSGRDQDRKGIIKNLTLIDPNISAGTGNYIGALAGFLHDGYIWDCSIEGGTVSGDESVGTLVGTLQHNGVVGNCTVKDSSVSGNMYVGGLIGYADRQTIISNCSTICTVTGNSNIGGLAGLSGAKINNSYAAGNVSGDHEVGGLVGHNETTLSFCYAIGNVTGDEAVGGLIGWDRYGTLVNCYAAAIVDGNDYTGGLVGYEFSSESTYYLHDTFYTKCFWNNTINPTLDGIGNNTDPNATGKSTGQLRQEDTFTDWDFDYSWAIAENQTYPYIKLSLPGDLDRNGFVDMTDCAIMANNWMDFSPWAKRGYQTVLDGITLVQIMLQGLEEVNLRLTRMLELATQSATGSYSATQHTIMNAEFHELIDQIDSIAKNTSYNGFAMLNTGASDYSVDTGSQYLYVGAVDMTKIGLGLAPQLDISTAAGAQVTLDTVNTAIITQVSCTVMFNSYLDSLLIFLSTY